MLVRKSRHVWEQEEGTRFIVVDLDVFSRRRLSVLAAAFEKTKIRNGHVSVLHEGPWRRGRYSAHFELHHWPDSNADRQIQGLIALMKKMPKRARQLWEAALSREFNIGIEAELEPHSREFKLSPRTIALVAEARATVVITVYAPDPQRGPGAVRKRR